ETFHPIHVPFHLEAEEGILGLRATSPPSRGHTASGWLGGVLPYAACRGRGGGGRSGLTPLLAYNRYLSGIPRPIPNLPLARGPTLVSRPLVLCRRCSYSGTARREDAAMNGQQGCWTRFPRERGSPTRASSGGVARRRAGAVPRDRRATVPIGMPSGIRRESGTHATWEKRRRGPWWLHGTKQRAPCPRRLPRACGSARLARSRSGVTEPPCPPQRGARDRPPRSSRSCSPPRSTVSRVSRFSKCSGLTFLPRSVDATSMPS